MRLLNATSLKFRDFPDESRFPPYVILSHTWDDRQEVTLQDMASPYLTDKKGYSKITNTCRLARDRNIEWVWIDTCCIDKTNNTELTESINSMYRWYQLARVCLVHLADFTKTPLRATQATTAGAGADLSWRDLLTQQDADAMADCAWFQRGWTLQELLAPAAVEFYDTAWTHIGSKAQLCALVSRITRIPEGAIRGTVDIAAYSTAQRMAWASSRVTTKLEDAAYSLLGLFDVNMPLIYGEGRRAFQRLQEEILKIATDFTLFGWMPADTDTDGALGRAPQAVRGDGGLTAGPCMPLLASSPRQFQNCYDLERFRDDDSEFSITNRGLRLTAYLVLMPVPSTNVDSFRSSEGSRPSLDILPSGSRSMQDVLGLGGGGVSLGLGDHSHGHGHSKSSPVLASSRYVPRQHRYRYVLTIGRRRTEQPGKTNKTKKHVVNEIGIYLRKMVPGQFIREGNQALATMSQDELRTTLNTTEIHTFYITLRPSGLGSMAAPLSGPLQSPSLRGHTPPQQPAQRFDGPAKPAHPALHLSTQAPSITMTSSSSYGFDAADWRSSPTTGAYSPMTPMTPTNASVPLRYSDLPPHHALRTLYHRRMLHGIFIPSLVDRNIVYGNVPLQPFDERLRILCLPESASEVIAFSCKSRQPRDELLFSVLVDFRQGRSHPQCKVVDRSSVQSQFFFALSMRSQSEPMRWYTVEAELPAIKASTGTLWLKPAGAEHTYKIVATADSGPVPIDGYTLLMPTLDITITDATESA